MTLLTGAELGAYLGIPDSDADPRLNATAAATTRAITRYCGRTFEATTTSSASARVYRPKSHTLCLTDDFWTTDSLAVAVDDGDDGVYEVSLTLNTDYIVEPLNGLEDGITVPYRRLRAVSWLFSCHATFPSVQVTAAWGWSSIPDEVKEAAKIQGARWFRRKDSPEGVLGGFQEFGAVRVPNRMDPDVQALLRFYRTAEASLLLV